jgi:hypothetical protein
MQGRVSGTPDMPVKGTALKIIYKKREYIICNEGQLNYVREQAKELIRCEAIYNKEDLTLEEFERRLEDHMANKCPYATLDQVLAMMTPAEQLEWKMNYRFTPIVSKKGR